MKKYKFNSSLSNVIRLFVIQLLITMLGVPLSSAQQVQSSSSVLRDVILSASSSAVSPDGQTIAFFTPGSGLFLMNIKSGKDQLLIKNVDMQFPLDEFENLVFAPDGKSLFFTAGVSGRGYSRTIYSISIAGDKLTQIAPGPVSTPASDSIGKQADYDYQSLSISPDGTTLLVSIVATSGKADEEGIPLHSGDLNYIATVPATAKRQNPKRLFAGNTPVWSSDSKAIIYDESWNNYFRYDLATGQKSALSLHGKILGRNGGTDQVFVTERVNGKDEITIQSLGLDGTGSAISPELTNTIDSITAVDASTKGRINNIQEEGNGQLWLLYQLGTKTHLQLIK
jgi:WD40-like Beta Propeller Repeat